MTGKAQKHLKKDGGVESGQGITFQTNVEEELAFTTEFPRGGRLNKQRWIGKHILILF